MHVIVGNVDKLHQYNEFSVIKYRKPVLFFPEIKIFCFCTNKFLIIKQNYHININDGVSV